MTNGAVPGMLKVMKQGEVQTEFCASSKACRSEPAPESFVFVTMTVPPLTATESVLLSFAAVGSASVASALPVMLCVPTLEAVVLIVTAVKPAAIRLPRLHVTTPAANAHGGVAETNVSVGGIGAVKM